MNYYYYYYYLKVPICLGHAAVWCFIDALVFAMMDRSIGLPEVWEDTPSNNLFFDWGKVTTESGGLKRFIVRMICYFCKISSLLVL
jgi:hypothetical protein